MAPEIESDARHSPEPAEGPASAPLLDLKELGGNDTSEFRITSKPDADGQTPLFSPGELATPLPGQASRYDELYVPSGGIAKYRKGIAALHSVPASGSHTLNSRRVMDAIVAVVQLHYKKLHKQQRDVLRELNASPMFYASKGQLRTLAGIASKNFGRVEDVLERLHDMKITWNVLGEDSEVQWNMRSRFLASYGTGVGAFSGHVCFSIDPRVLELILEPRLWVTLNLDVQKQLGTETSYALYQNAWRYIGTANKVTADFPAATWIELLMGPCRYVRTEANGVKRVVDYSEWKGRHLRPAIERINGISALSHSLELIEKRSGLKVTRLQFRFVPKQQAALDLPMTWPDQIVESLRSLGFEDSELGEMAQGFSLDEVVASLSRYRQSEARKRAAGQRIEVPKAFFHGILGNVSSQGGLDEKAEADIERKVRTEEAARRAQEDRERVSYEFGQYQTRRLMDNLAAWPPARQEALRADFEASSEYVKARALMSKGWDKAGVGAWAVIKAWLSKSRADDYYELLPNPEDQDFSAWLIWRHSTPGAQQ